MLWGGLRPIRSRLCLDLIILAASGYSIFNETTYATFLPISLNTLALSAACILTFASAGLTKRWTISFPLVPIILLQTIRLCYLETQALEENLNVNENDSHYAWTWIALFFIRGSSILLVAFSAILTVLFPAVDISQAKGKYNVGIVDLHLPVKFDEEKCKIHQFDMASKENQNNTMNGFVSVRLLYPTLDSVEPTPYFNQDTAKMVCEALMRIGAPPPLNKLKWMLHTWLLSKIQVKRNAEPKPTQEGGEMPVVIFSHGLTGNIALYSYQCMNLASHGSCVLSIEHSDGSGIGMKKHDGSFLPFDSSIGLLEKVCKIQHIRARRKQADHRACEMLAATAALVQFNKSSYIPELEENGVSFENKLDIYNIAVGGHSFGAATAVTAAARKPDLYSCVIAHDPALNWVPDDARRILFAGTRFQGSNIEYDGGEAGFEIVHLDVEEKKELRLTNSNESKLSLHDLDLFFLYSNVFAKQGWGEHPIIFDMFRRGQLGPEKNNRSECSFVYASHHSEFSDSSMTTPLWLARATGHTGKRNPHETSEEIATRTLYFLNEVSAKQVKKQKLK